MATEVEYQAEWRKYRASLRESEAVVIAYLHAQGHAEAEIGARLDHIYREATGDSPTTWCVLHGTEHPADALALPLLFRVWMALRSAHAVAVGFEVALQDPPMPRDEQEMATMLLRCWELDHAHTNTNQ
jgi:hypothetical protein